MKFAVFNTATGTATVSGMVEEIGNAAKFKAKYAETKTQKSIDAPNHQHALVEIQNFLKEIGEDQDISAIGHRVVHGCEEFANSVLITPAVLKAVEECSALAPLHNPPNLQGIAAARKNFPTLPQVAVFDTAFHQTIPKHAFLYALPYQLYTDQKVRKYGFHGSSHRFVARETAKILGKDSKELCLIIAHLGNGCSATAVKFGESADTTMGLTPLEGIAMGTRSGSIDPGILFYLNKTLNYDFDRLNKLLNKESGLLGLSGISSDMRTVLEIAGYAPPSSVQTEDCNADSELQERAKIAVEVFCYRLAKEISSLAAALPKIDALVFTGGIGENSKFVREKALSHLGIFGFTKEGEFQNGKPQVLVVPTNEELLIAQDTEKVVNNL
ncbi:acetate kinase [Fibrobacterales bacterium]|nr:acetate kinase [Fibrobacterales bacterium]